jgi:outer membrane protein
MIAVEIYRAARTHRTRVVLLVVIVLISLQRVSHAQSTTQMPDARTNPSRSQTTETTRQTQTNPSSIQPVGGALQPIGSRNGTQQAPSLAAARQLPGAAKQSTGPTQLSVETAIQLAIQNNLATLLAAERKREADGVKRQALAPLLPNLYGTSYQADVTENLAALGFQGQNFPGLSTFVGPFRNFDARAHLVQTIFDLSALRNYEAGKAAVHAAEFEESLAREQVAAGTTLLYLELIRTERNVLSAEANVQLAQALLKLAQDQRNAGVATGLDVARAETRVAQEQVRLARSHTMVEEARLSLQRVIGLPLGQALVLTDQLVITEEPVPAVEIATAEAARDRPEIKIAEAEIRQTQLERSAVHAEYLPSLEFVGDYGISGITPTESALPTRRAAIQLNVPIFNGGRTQGRLSIASSRERQAELQFGNVRGQVEEDVRLALVTIRTATAQVRAAQDAVRLAQREVEMSQDRFRAGVTDNLEVISALTGLANARDEETNAMAQYKAARINLAAALGHAESFHW